MSIDYDAMYDFARVLASTPSPSTHEQAAIRLTESEMVRLGFDTQIDSAGNLIGTMGAGEEGQPRLLIDGHIDTIPLHSMSDWTVDPHGGVVIDGKLFGLGICDQKASIAAAIYGVGSLASHFRSAPGLIAVVASVCEEETEGAALAEALDIISPTLAITTEPNDATLAVGQRGRAKILASIRGRASHAGHVDQGVNAALALSQLVTTLADTPRPSHKQLGFRDITCIDILTDPYPSVSTVPNLATAHFDARFLPGETRESLLGVIKQAANEAWRSWITKPELVLEIEVAVFETYTGRGYRADELSPAWWTEGDVVQNALSALDEVGLSTETMSYSFCTNGSLTAGVRGIPTLGYGVGEEHIAHQANEYVTLDSLKRGAEGLSALAARFVPLTPSR